MNSVTKYVLGIVALAGAIFFSWYFFSVIVYILVAAVISFIGRPIIDLLGRVKIRGYRLPDGLKAGITVICLWGLFILFFSTIIPLAIREFQSLGNVSVSNIVSELEIPIEDAGHFMKHYGLMDEDQDVDAYVTDLLSKVFNVGQLKTWFGTVAGTMTDIFVALFSITFILFFFLKDSRLFSGMVMAVLPSRFEEQARNALDSIQKLLVRYFVGLLLEVLGVMALNTIGLTIVGLGFSNAVVIGLVTGVLNPEEFEELHQIMLRASEQKEHFVPLDWEEIDCPEVWGENGETITYDWFDNEGPTMDAAVEYYNAKVVVP